MSLGALAIQKRLMVPSRLLEKVFIFLKPSWTKRVALWDIRYNYWLRRNPAGEPFRGLYTDFNTILPYCKDKTEQSSAATEVRFLVSPLSHWAGSANSLLARPALHLKPSSFYPCDWCPAGRVPLDLSWAPEEHLGMHRRHALKGQVSWWSCWKREFS